MDKEAEYLNKQIVKEGDFIFKLLSERGENIYFPNNGIVKQAIAAKGRKINATAGIALDDNQKPMVMKPVKNMVANEEHVNYESSYGMRELREKWHEHILKLNPSIQNEITVPIVTSGITHAAFIAGFLFINPGDRVIIPDMRWENYDLIFRNHFGAELEEYEMFRENRFNLEGFKDKLEKELEKAIILFNFPNNPTGYTPTKEEVKSLIEIIKEQSEKKKILVIIDDAYFNHFYEKECSTESLFAELCGIKNILAVKLDGATKELYAWGLRVGFITFSHNIKALEEKAAGTVRSTISNASKLSQEITLKALESEDYEKEIRKNYDALYTRYKKVKEIVKKNINLKALPFNSGYFMCIKIDDKSHAEKLRERLLTEYDTGVVSLGDVIRITYASIPEEKIETVFELIDKAYGEIK